MTKKMNEAPDYGNWVSNKFVMIPGIIGLIFLGLALFFPILGILSLFFLPISIYFIYARYLFSHHGKNVQGQTRSLVVSYFKWSGTGKLLDIGCGSAALTIELAKKYPEAIIIGIDNWGKGWEYSQQACENNARIEGVNHQCSFQMGSASELPFPDDSFDAAVSNLVFHEVAGSKDKRVLLQEALRVMKKGGAFVFQDLFLLEPYYGKIDDLLQTIRGWGVSEVEFIETRKSSFIPTALKLPFMMGTIGLLVGRK
ncbi:MAG: class I SAM-dependent methyltransferase [Ignavibacteria bacterium]|nr:class I SAM-dependent methyltransferase [Ignavibacteria bacterium]